MRFAERGSNHWPIVALAREGARGIRLFAPSWMAFIQVTERAAKIIHRRMTRT